MFLSAMPRGVSVAHIYVLKNTITSSVNGRQFSIINNNDLDWTSSDLIYVITWTETNCGMQYVGQTDWSLKIRFREHFHKMKKPKKFDTFLYRHFQSNGHSPSKIVIQPVEKIIYNPNSSTRLKKYKETWNWT